MDTFSVFGTSLGEMSLLSQELFAIALNSSVNVLAGIGTIIMASAVQQSVRHGPQTDVHTAAGR